MKRKSLILLTAIMVSASALFSQTASDWKFITEKDGVKIFSKEVVNNNTEQNFKHEYYLLKFENTNKEQVKVTWKLDIYLNGVCRTCPLTSPNEYELSLTLNGNETKTGTLKDEGKEMKIFKKDLKMENSSVTTFKLNNIVILK